MTDYSSYSGDSKEIVGDYRLVSQLGRGTFGTVYLAEHVHEHTQVAVKVLNLQLTDQKHLKDFLNEARTMRLRHPHIVPLLDFGLSRENRPFLVMEYIPKGTMRVCFPKGTRLPPVQVATYAQQIAEALQYAHDRRLIHRDVKPENMLLRDTHTVLLADFGITITTPSINHSSLHTGGTPGYMAPEQLQGHPRPASDQYALGVVVYEWLAGERPFKGTLTEVVVQHMKAPPPSLHDRYPALSPEIETVIQTALAKRPDERFANMLDFANALQRACTPSLTGQMYSRNISSAPAGPATPIAQPPRLDAAVFSPNAQHAPLSPEPKTEVPLEYDNLKSPALPEKYGNKSAQQQFLTKYKLLLALLILLLIGAGSYTYSTIQASTTQMQAATTALHNATATVAARGAFNAYTAHVAQQGIMFGFDAQHTRHNIYEHILNSANIAHLQRKWAATTGDIISSSPAVANGLVYVGSNDGKLYAFDALTGQQRWAVAAGNNISSSPAVVNGIIYIGSADNNLYAFDALTGQKKWASATGSYVTSSPVVVNGIVYVGSWNNSLYAFDALTGQQKWFAGTANVVNSSPIVANGLVYVGSTDHNLYAFDALTGQRKWTALTNNGIPSSPAIANGLVYVGSFDGKVYAFDALTGQQKWAVDTGKAIGSSAAIANGLVYIGSANGKLYALDALTGQQKWLALAGSEIESSPTIANGLLYIGTQDGKLHVFDALTGQQKLALAMGQAVAMSSSPAVANGYVYIGSFDHNLYAFSL